MARVNVSSPVRHLVLARDPRPGAAPRCPYCHAAILSREARWRCAGCATLHHRECAHENARCAVHGCARDEGRAEEGGLVVRIVTRPEACCLGCLEPLGATTGLWVCRDCGRAQHLACFRRAGHCAVWPCASLDGELARRETSSPLARGLRALGVARSILVVALWAALLGVTFLRPALGTWVLAALVLSLPLVLGEAQRLVDLHDRDGDRVPADDTRPRG